jgi:hypothetical protein
MKMHRLSSLAVPPRYEIDGSPRFSGPRYGAVLDHRTQAGDLLLQLAVAAHHDQDIRDQDQPGGGKAVAEKFVVVLEALGLASNIFRG